MNYKKKVNTIEFFFCYFRPIFRIKIHFFFQQSDGITAVIYKGQIIDRKPYSVDSSPTIGTGDSGRHGAQSQRCHRGLMDR